MSVTEYGCQRVTHEQMRKCLLWCQNQLQLRDWGITLYTGDTPPKIFMGEEGILDHFYGMSKSFKSEIKATIWVNAPLHKQSNKNEYATIIHEALHVFLVARSDIEEDEQAVRILEPMLYRLYCADNNLIIKEKK